MPKIKSFLEERSAQLAQKKESTPEESTDMLAEAISLGIAEALNHPAFDGTSAIVIDTNLALVTPVGTLARNAFKVAALTPALPNPNLSRPY